MVKFKKLNINDLISKYDDDFINNITLNNISSLKELKELHSKLEIANYVVTEYYKLLYNDYIMMINSECPSIQKELDVDTVKSYKSLSSKIQKAYNYITYMITFENPFKR